ncbi:MAG TPA: ABC transporter permease [Chloroflexota bacterium]|nr:ABC transporter permease [Chloroflexota bacterium]
MIEATEARPAAPNPSPPAEEPHRRWYAPLGQLAVPLGAIALAIIIGGVVMGVAVSSCQGGSICSSGLPKHISVPLNAYWQLLIGAFGTPYDIQETLVYAVPLMFAAFAVAFAFRGGLFNIGAEGQLYAAAIASTFVGYSLTWPGWILLPVCIVVGVLAGALWALIPGLLKAYRGAHEVITTMMLNYVALNLMHFLLINGITGTPGFMQGPLPGNPISKSTNTTFPIIVPHSWVPNAQLNLSLVLALICGVIFTFLLFRTTLGYAVRAVGSNIKAARYAGIHVNRTIVLTMLISGGFAGLAGMSYVFGIGGGQMADTFDNFTYGFDAIAVALLGKNTAVGAILAAVLFGALDHGGTTMQATAGIDTHIISIIQGLIIFFVGAEALVRFLGGRGFTVTRFRAAKPETEVPAERAAV